VAYLRNRLPPDLQILVVETAEVTWGVLKLTPADVPPVKKPKNHRMRLRSVIQNAALMISP
jgi:hypothetical protein